MNSFLSKNEPMGIYQMLYAFMEAAGTYMGEPGTHPWSQDFPLTSQLPGGPEIPGEVKFSSSDLKYPKAWGNDSLRKTIANYYQEFYGAQIAPENVMVFAGGRAALFSTFFLMQKEVQVLVEETEYTPYFDLLQILKRDYTIVPSNESNGFLPSLEDYKSVAPSSPFLCLRSNPCNPTGQVMEGQQLKEFVSYCSEPGRGALIDEAYEFFVSPEPVSALKYIDNIDETNIFVAGAATKGLQVPGARIGWIVASRENINTLASYATFAFGGVSRLSQLFVETLLEKERVSLARKAVSRFYADQRDRYGKAFSEMGLELHTGKGGFYHWAKLPQGLTADELNQRLFKQKAAILPGRLCDMHRRGAGSAHQSFFRFSFGPLTADTFEEDVKILRSALM